MISKNQILPLFVQFYFLGYHFMKSILSPYDDFNFNTYLLQYVKKRLTRRYKQLTKDGDDRKYFLEENSRDYYTPEDLIDSVKLNGRSVYFSNSKLINYVVYDLSQRFWYDEFKHINNTVRKLYLEFVRISKEFDLQQKRLSNEKANLSKPKKEKS